MENNINAQGVAEILQQEETRRVAVSAGRATIGNTWIAFAALMVTLLVIGVGAVFGYAQLIDQVKGNAEDTKELKGEVRNLSATVNLMAGRLGVQPQSAGNLIPTRPSLLSCSTFAVSDQGSTSTTYPLTLVSLPERGLNHSKPGQAACDLLTLCHLPAFDLSRSPYETRLHW